MSILTPAAFFALATVCAPGLDARMLLVQAQRESRLDTAATHQNTNGTTDYGLMQLNSANFQLLGIRSISEAFDPCRNLRGAADLYHTLSRYNSGNATTSIAPYASDIIAGIRTVSAERPVAITNIREITTPPTQRCPVWDMWARRSCEKSNKE